MKIAIIGSGISGLSIGRMLTGQHEVAIFEKENKIGGLIKCERVNDNLFHKVGGHVFNSKNQQVLNWFWSHFKRDSEFLKVKRNAKVFFNNKIVGYPIENYLYMLEENVVTEIFSELIQLQTKPRKSPFEFENFGSFLRYNFGDTLFELYFKPYNQKIWKVDLGTVSMEWLEGKLPMPDFEEMVLSNVLRKEEDQMVHSTFYYAREGGSQFIVDRLAQGLVIKTGTTVSEIFVEDGKYRIGEDSGFDKIIYCGDIRKLPASVKSKLENSSVDMNYLEHLRSNGTSNLFCETDDIDISWLYIPEAFTKAHRIIYTGNFSESNNRGAKRKTCVVEFSGQVSFEQMVLEIKKLPGKLSPIAYNYEPNSYIIHDSSTRAAIANIKGILENENFYLLGRFAEWEYYNMDKCIEAAFGLADKISCSIST